MGSLYELNGSDSGLGLWKLFLFYLSNGSGFKNVQN